MKKTILILMTLGFVSLTQAGQETHGGDYIVCPNRKTVVLDYFQAQLPTFSGAPELVDISGMDADQVIQYFTDSFYKTTLAYDFERYIKTVGNYKKWIIVDKLVDQNDENLPFVPTDCDVKQGAVRQNGLVYISRDAIAQLSPEQIGVLAVHEALSEMLVSYKSEIFSSSQVRTLISEFLLQKPNFVNIAQIFDPYYRASTPFCSGQFYSSASSHRPGEPINYEGLYFSFKKGLSSGIFETNSGEKIDIFKLQSDYSLEFFHLYPLVNSDPKLARSGILFFEKEKQKKYFLGRNIFCVAKDNECISSLDEPGPNDVSVKYGRLHIVFDRMVKIYFDQDPEKRVFVDTIFGYAAYSGNGYGCISLGNMQRQSRGQVSR